MIVLWLLLTGLLCASEYRVFVDVGHGGRDPGALGLSGYKEKDICLLFANDLQTALKHYKGVEVQLSRQQDTYVSLKKRLAMANKHPIDAFISVHMDKGSQAKFRGMTAYVQSRASSDNTSAFLKTAASVHEVVQSKYAEQLSAMLMQVSHDESYKLAQSVLVYLRQQGVRLHAEKPRRRELYLFHQHVPNFLLELGFISNHEDVALIIDVDKRRAMARAVAAGIYAYLQQ